LSETRSPYSAKEVAALIGVSDRTVRRWIAEGQLPARRYGRQLRIAAEDIDRFVDRAGFEDSLHQISDQAFAEDWDNDLDAAYDTWESIYGAQPG
jgi:excisionase family DNA binding protein